MIPASELETPRTIEEYRLAVERVRRQSARRRTEAWACVPETVLGIELSPITPARYSALVGTENAFLSGCFPLESDLRNFIWFCSPQFNPDSPIASLRWKPLQMYRLKCALGRHARGDSKPESVLKNFITACAEINRMVETAFADRLPGNDDNPKPLAAALEAQLVDMFAREYQHWPLPQPMRHTPIKQLYQLARCIDRNSLGNRACYFDPAEWALDRAFLGAINPNN